MRSRAASNGGAGTVEESALEMPKGWEEVVSEEDGSVYYYNSEQNKTQWTHPALGEDEDIVVDLLDPSMIFSLER